VHFRVYLWEITTATKGRQSRIPGCSSSQRPRHTRSLHLSSRLRETHKTLRLFSRFPFWPHTALAARFSDKTVRYRAWSVFRTTYSPRVCEARCNYKLVFIPILSRTLDISQLTVASYGPSPPAMCFFLFEYSERKMFNNISVIIVKIDAEIDDFYYWTSNGIYWSLYIHIKTMWNEIWIYIWIYRYFMHFSVISGATKLFLYLNLFLLWMHLMQIWSFSCSYHIF